MVDRGAPLPRLLRSGLLLFAVLSLIEGQSSDAIAGGFQEGSGQEDQARFQKMLLEKAEANTSPVWTISVGAAVAVALAVAIGFRTLLLQHLKPLAACLLFMWIGPTLITLNKNIMEGFDFPFPLTLSGLGLFSSNFVAQVLVRGKISQLRPSTVERVSGRNFCRVVLPLAFTKALALASGNAVYLHLSLGFIQMLKAFTPAILLVVMVVARVEPPARPARWCVLVIVIGTVITVQGEMRATTIGLFLMSWSCIAEAISMVLNQKILQSWNFSEVEAMYYVAGPSLLVLAVPAAILEWGTLWSSQRYMVFVEQPLHMAVAASLGVGVNFVTLFVISLTSSMTVKVLNTFRCIILVAVGMLFYGETRSRRQLWGYAVSLLGFIGYNYFQMKRDKAKALEEWVDGQLLRCRGKQDLEKDAFMEAAQDVGIEESDAADAPTMPQALGRKADSS